VGEYGIGTRLTDTAALVCLETLFEEKKKQSLREDCF